MLQELYSQQYRKQGPLSPKVIFVTSFMHSKLWSTTRHSRPTYRFHEVMRWHNPVKVRTAYPGCSIAHMEKIMVPINVDDCHWVCC